MQSWEGAQAGVPQPWRGREGSRGLGCSERGRPGAGLELAVEGMWRGEREAGPLSPPRPGEQSRLTRARMEASAPPQRPLLATSRIGAGGDSHPCFQLCAKDLPVDKFVSVVLVVFLVVYQKYFSGCLLESSLLMPKTTTTV